MAFDPAIHHRRSIRLQGHDYAGGGIYYVTLVTEGWRRLFGGVINGRMVLSDAGRIVQDEWVRSARIREEIALDEWVVMPDHFHAVVAIRSRGDRQVARMRREEGDLPVARTLAGRSLGALIAGFKGAVGKRINELRGTPGVGVWHRNYYEHVVRDEADLVRIRRYIRANPANYDPLRFGPPRFMMGNPDLFQLPKTAFLASRRADDRQGAPPGAALFASSPACVISGFLSPMERQVFRDCLERGIPVIQVLACGLPRVLPAHVRAALASGRLLIMTPFPAGVRHVNAVRAAWCNQYLLHAADRIVIGALTPGGMLALLLADMPTDKTVVMPL